MFTAGLIVASILMMVSSYVSDRNLKGYPITQELLWVVSIVLILFNVMLATAINQ